MKNKKSVLRFLGWFLILLIFPSIGSAQEFKVSNIYINQARWGLRQLIVRVENHLADSVRMEIVLYTLYEDHHVSGLDRAMYDIQLVVPPGHAGAYKVDFELPGSYHKRLVSRAFVYWEYPDPLTGQSLRDSTFQSFNNVFFPTDEAFEIANNKYLIGPIGVLDGRDLLAFDYPRMMLYLLGRGESTQEISARFEVEPSYTEYLVDEAEQMGLLTQVSDSGQFGASFISFSEREGYDFRQMAQWASRVFKQWYDRDGKKELTRVLKESGIEEPALSMPSVRMQVLLSRFELLFGHPPDKADLVAHPEFKDFKDDISFRQKPLWIIQGGEFFAPKVSLMSFVKSNRLYLGTFRYAPVQKYEKSPINDLKRVVDDYPDSIAVVKAESLLKAKFKFGSMKGFRKLEDQVMKMVEKSSHHYRDRGFEYMHSLRDFYFRFMLGELFDEMQKEMRFDCVRVEYDR